VKVLVAGASSETQYVGSLTSCYELARRPGDEIAIEHRTIGYVAREGLVDALLAKPDLDAILLLDADQRHPADLLERLRAAMTGGDLDMVCAHYYRRGTQTVQSLCYAVGDGTYPYLPLLDPPTSGLHEIAVTGFGCVLIHRRVIEAVAASLPPGEHPVSIGPLPDVTGDHDIVGQDFRFFIRARRLGFRLWLLADVESLHGTTIWLGHKSARRLMNYTKWADASYELFEERLRLHGMTPEAFKQRHIVLEARRRGLIADVEQAIAEQRLDAAQALTVAIHEMTGKLKEMEAWIEWAERYPPIDGPEDLPTAANSPPMAGAEPESAAARGRAFQQRAQELIETLPVLDGDHPGRNGAGRAD
jgi:hypothetical protein